METSLLRNGGSNGRVLSPTTVLQVHRILSKALKDALKLGIVRWNVAEAVEPPRITRYEARTLTWDEVPKFLEQVNEPLYRTLFLLDIQTGLRCSELLGLRWRDIDLQAGTLPVQRVWVKLPSGSKVLSVPKSGLGRVVALPSQSIETLRTHWERQRDVSGNGDFVFCHSHGTLFDPDRVTKKFKKMAKESGVGDMRLHDLRHTHASLMLAEGVQLRAYI